MALSSRRRCLLLLCLTAIQIGHAAVQVRAISFMLFAQEDLARQSWLEIGLSATMISQNVFRKYHDISGIVCPITLIH